VKLKIVCGRCCLIQAVSKIAIGYWYKSHVGKYHSIRLKKKKFIVLGYWKHSELSTIPAYKGAIPSSLFIYPVDLPFRSWVDVQVSTWCRLYFYTFLALEGDPLGANSFRSFFYVSKMKNKSLFHGHII
jgi:hypothetical protein